MQFKLLFFIALGGAAGAVGRFLFVTGLNHWFGLSSAIGTFFINCLGSFLLGLLISIMEFLWSVDESVKAMLVVGFLGSLTTFSAFSRDCVMFFGKGEYGYAFIYIVGSVALSLVGFILGLSVIRSQFS